MTKSSLGALAEAYDALVAMVPEEMDFSRQAALVAVFTRRYAEVFLRVDEHHFAELMRKHRELHARADRLEQRRKSPLQALKRELEEGGDLGRVLRRFANHLGALDCLLDLRATAALVHHLLLLEPAPEVPEQVTGCELGSGSGILAVAATVPFLRRGKTLSLHAFEQAAESSREAVRTFAALRQESRRLGQVNLHFHQGDITSPEPYRLISEAERESGPLALWLSETFGFQTRSPKVVPGKSSCIFTTPQGAAPYAAETERDYDPLPTVLELSCRFFPDFLVRMAQGRLVAFPDIVTPRVIIDGSASKLLAADGNWRRLGEIGDLYPMLPRGVPTRWHYRQETAPRKRGRFLHSAAKRKKLQRK